MAKLGSRSAKFSLGAVALEGSIADLEQNVNVKILEVTCLGDTGPRKIEDTYDWDYSLSGPNDYASANIDASLFGRIGNGGAATDFSPTGSVAGPNDPHYTGTSAILESYSIKVSVGKEQSYSAKLAGNSALTRAVA